MTGEKMDTFEIIFDEEKKKILFSRSHTANGVFIMGLR